MGRPKKIKEVSVEPVYNPEDEENKPTEEYPVAEEPKAAEVVEKPKMRCLKCTSNGGRIYAWDEHSASRDDMIEVWIERP